MRLILIRHALPHRVSGADERGAGPADPGLTEHGHRQAARLADAVRAADRPGVLYVSPLRRARETAAPLAAALGLSARVEPGLAEYDAEARDYVPAHEMARRAPRAWARMRAGELPPYVDRAAFRTRVSATLERIAEDHPGEATVACVAHAGVINVYLAGLLGADRPLPFPLDYVGISRVVVSREGWRRVRSVNETGHVADLL